jgi:nucleotide exchange factor SIL1
VATNEWQKIEPGQAIPKGLHVRMNLQTGEREARLLQSDESQSTSQDNKDTVYTHEYLKKALKNIKAETLNSESSFASEVCFIF